MSVVADSQVGGRPIASQPTDAVTVPRFKVDLDAPKGTRWNHIIEIYKGSIKSVESQIDEVIKKEAPNLAAIGEAMLGAASKMGLVYYGDELVGISKACGVSVGRLTAMQLVYEAAAACTSVTFQSQNPNSFGANGAPAHCRTMDWEMDFLKALTIEVAFVRQGKPVCIATTWAGYVGVLTGMGIREPQQQQSNISRNFSVSVNFRVTEKGTYWDNVKKTLGRAWPVGFLLREVLTDPKVRYSTAVAQLTNSELIAPTYLTVCGSRTGEGCLITRDRVGEVNPLGIEYKPSFASNTTTTSTTTGGGSAGGTRSEAPTSSSLETGDEEVVDETMQQIPGGSTTTPASEASGQKKLGTSLRDNTVVCNMDHWGSADIFYSRARVHCAETSLTKLRNKKAPVTVEDLWALLSASPVRNELTVYGTVMIPATGYYETRLPRSDAVGFIA